MIIKLKFAMNKSKQLLIKKEKGFQMYHFPDAQKLKALFKINTNRGYLIREPYRNYLIRQQSLLHTQDQHLLAHQTYLLE